MGPYETAHFPGQITTPSGIGMLHELLLALNGYPGHIFILESGKFKVRLASSSSRIIM